MGLKHVKERHEDYMKKRDQIFLKGRDHLKTGNYLETRVKKILNKYGLHCPRLLTNR